MICEQQNNQKGASNDETLVPTTTSENIIFPKKDENSIRKVSCSPSNCSSWRNHEDHDNLRRGMLFLLQKILFSTNKKKEVATLKKIMKDKTCEEQREYTSTLLKKVEYHLYQSASSLKDYANVGTLQIRIRATAIKAIESAP